MQRKIVIHTQLLWQIPYRLRKVHRLMIVEMPYIKLL